MKVEITNQQSLKSLNLKSLHRQLKKTLKLLDLSSQELSLVLCDNKFIKKLNKKYFKKSSATDVISFSLKDKSNPNYLGEVVVSVEEAINVGNRHACSLHKWQDEVLLYCIHGILHLIGYDDRTKKQREDMSAKEKEILRKL